jgi:hypothetical protein
MMGNHTGEADTMSMPEIDRDYLENLIISLLETDSDGGNGHAGGEPLTLHRRGHWFKSSIAHHLKNIIKLPL